MSYLPVTLCYIPGRRDADLNASDRYAPACGQILSLARGCDSRQQRDEFLAGGRQQAFVADYF
jgi:hypothetical protein